MAYTLPFISKIKKTVRNAVTTYFSITSNQKQCSEIYKNKLSKVNLY